MSEEVKKSKGIFGINKDVQSKANVPLLTPIKLDKPDPKFPTGVKFPIARLINVKSNTQYEKNDGTIVPVLQFVFVDSDKRQYTHFEWEIEESDNKFDKKVGWMQARIKHIYEETIGEFPDNGIGNPTGDETEENQFALLFNIIESDFNKVTIQKNDKPVRVFTQHWAYYKLVYYNGNLQFPFPNFLERITEKDQPCKTLSIGKKDTIDQEASKKATTGIPGMDSTPDGSDDLPAFDASYS